MNNTIQILEEIISSKNSPKSSRLLEKETELLYSILSSLSEGVIVADRNGRFLFFNPSAEKILGIGAKDVSPSEWTITYGCYYPDKVTPFPAERLPLAQAIKEEKFSEAVIFIKNPEKPDGVFIQVSASPLRDETSFVNGGIVIFRDITASKQAEIALKTSEAREKAQFKEFPIPTYIWQKNNGDFVLIDYNNAAETFTNGKVRQLLGTTLRKMYENTTYFTNIQKDFNECLVQKTHLVREMTYQFQSSGEIKDLIVKYVSIPPDLVMVHTEDVTEKKLAEEKVKKLSEAIEQTADSVIITDKKGKIEYVNSAFETTTGYSRAEVLSQTPKILNSGRHDAAFYENLWETILNGHHYRGTIINRKKNRELYWSEQTITPMKDDAGNITNFVSVLKDITELRQKQEQEFQLRIAQEIQERLFTTRPEVPGFDIAGKTFPAVETGGDYFDFIPLPDGCLGLVIADVSGHGVGAALIMTATRAYLRAFSKHESDPGILLTQLNDELTADLQGENFLTMFFLRLDPQQYRIDYVSAGHVPGYIFDESNQVKHKLTVTDIPMGFKPNHRFKKSDIFQMAPGDMLALFTDGILEAPALDGTMFGFDRIIETLQRHQHKNAANIIDEQYQAVRHYTENQPQADDITSIICKVIPS